MSPKFLAAVILVTMLVVLTGLLAYNVIEPTLGVIALGSCVVCTIIVLFSKARPRQKSKEDELIDGD